MEKPVRRIPAMGKPERRGKPKVDEGKKITRKKRSPLQDLNGHPVCKTARRERSNPVSLAASISIEAPKGCLRMFLSSNSCSSSSSSSSRQKFPKPLPKLGMKNSSKLAPPKPKEIEASRKPSFQKSRIHPQGASKDTASLICKNGQRSKPLSNMNPGNKSKKEIQAKPKPSNSNGNCAGKPPFDRHRLPNLNHAGENVTPVGKFISLSTLDPKSSLSPKENSIIEISNSSVSDVKTPPVEPSLSPQIQRQSYSKILILNSGVTPVCYGAGHLVSGVTDNRKCRRRGSLRGGYESSNIFNKETSVEESAEALVPLPGGASVRWAVSPCREGHEEHGGDSPVRLSQRRIICDDNLSAPDLSSSPSLSLNTPDFSSDLSSFGNLEQCKARNKNNGVEAVRKATEFNVIFRALNDVDESLSVLSPIGSLGSHNIIQTPDSDGHDQINCSNLAEALCKLELSSPPGSDIPEWDASDSMPESVALSQMKISWQDRLVSTNVLPDESDCCCLLDEEINSDESPRKDALVEKEGNGLVIDMDISPIASEYEPCVLGRGKEKLTLNVPDERAVSISTDGGGLVASGDSEWTYSLNNHFFQVK